MLIKKARACIDQCQQRCQLPSGGSLLQRGCYFKVEDGDDVVDDDDDDDDGCGGCGGC